MRLGLERLGPRAWFALGIGVLSLSCTVTSQPAGANDEIAKLKGEVAELKSKMKAEEGAPPKGQEAAFVKSRETAFEEQIKNQKEDKGQLERHRLDLALAAANKAIDLPANQQGGKIETFHCYQTFCRVETTHTSEAAYEAFMNASFNGLPGKNNCPIVCGKDDERGTPRLYPGWYTVTQAKITPGKVATLFYVGRLPKDTPPDPTPSPATPVRVRGPQ
jgi:hypothetical protein